MHVERSEGDAVPVDAWLQVETVLILGAEISDAAEIRLGEVSKRSFVIYPPEAGKQLGL